MNETPLCRKSSEAARKAGELLLWKDSFQANILCRIAIENELRQHFDGMHLEDGCAGRVLDEFGEARVKYVLSATLQDRDYDGRFSRANKAWAKQTDVTPGAHNYEFMVSSHPAVLDGFVDQFREECVHRMHHGFVPVML